LFPLNKINPAWSVDGFENIFLCLAMPRFTHRPLHYGQPKDTHRIVFCDDVQLCQLVRRPNGAWGFFMDWTGHDGLVTCSSLDKALATIRALHDAFGAPKA